MTRWSLRGTRSFRLRIALLSVVVSGVLLAAFGGWTWIVFQRMNLRRIDDEIRQLGHRHLSANQGPEHWERVEESLQFFLGEKEEDAFLLLVKGRDNVVLHRSANWPEDLPPESFPAPSDTDEYMRVQPPPLRDGGPPEPPPPDPAQSAGEGRSDFDRAPPPPQPQPPPGRRAPPSARDHYRPREDRAGLLPLPGQPPPAPVHLRAPEFSTRNAGGQSWRMGVLGNPNVTLALAFSMSRFDADMVQVRRAFLLAIPVALVLIAVGGWLISQRALHPIKALTRAAETITAKGLDQRIPAEKEAIEFTRLTTVFNEMLDRLEKSFNQAVRFSADAAHELKTPLTILQGRLEQAIQEAQPDSDQQRVCSQLLAEVQRLKAIIRKLLLLSLADAGQLKLNRQPLNLTETLQAVCEDAEVLAPHLTVEKKLTPDVWIHADAHLIRQVVQNLTQNAVKFNRPGGSVKFWLKEKRGAVRFTVANTGPGIPPEDRGRIFERFYRADKARSRRIDGVGLGLSLSREIVRAHHGEIRLEDTPDGITAFSMTLPATKA